MASKNPHHKGNNNIEFDKIQGMITIQPQDLNIIWGEDKRYWNIQHGEHAELLQVCWLEVTGSVRSIDPAKSYKVSFNISLTPDAFGWGLYPLYFMLKTGKDEVVWQKVNIANENMTITGYSSPVKDKDQTDNSWLYFGLYEVWSGKWKGGLKIHNVIIEEVQEK